MSDLVERLLWRRTDGTLINPLGPEAADRIAQLEKRVEIEKMTRDTVLGSELKHWADKHKAQAARIAQLEAAVLVWREAYETGRNEPLVIAYESTAALGEYRI